MRRFPPASRRTSLVRLSIATAIASGLALTTISAQIPGRNVNMVSGTTWPDGDPFLQRQNEPSVAASTRNPLHLMAGSNDYRTVDVPGLGIEEHGDAWLGLYKSFDGGQRWTSTLLPGYPQDSSDEGRSSPIFGYSTGADPVVRAGTNGLMYYAGLAFDRSSPDTPTIPGKSAIFVARFIDNNNKEAGDTFAYLGTRLLQSDRGGNTGNFLDKPWMVVDIPRDNQRCAIVTPTEDGLITQNLPAGPVYVAYTLRSTDRNGPRYDVYFTRSADCGSSWTTPVRLNDALVRTSQGATMAVDPRNGDVYVAWRQFDLTGDNDSLAVVKYTRGSNTISRPGFAHKFAKPKKGKGKGIDPAKFFSKGGVSAAVQAARLSPLDQGTSPIAGALSFRTNAYPTIAVDGAGRVYLAWAERGFAEGDADPETGAARIRMNSSLDAVTWTTPATVSSGEPGQRGHQLMPSMTFAGGKLMLVYYDLRETRSQTFSQYIDDRTAFTNPAGTGLRHTLDIRASMGTPGAVPAFAPSVRVSDYLEGPRSPGGPNVPWQVNPPNLPMFVLGTSPFIGDYVDIAAAPQFVQAANGAWSYNTQSSSTLPVFHAVWTDNRDVRPPLEDANNNGNPWDDYVPPGINGGDSLAVPGATLGICVPGNAGSRNQNIYTARITGGLLVGSPGNSKRLSLDLMRSFVVFAQNTSDVTRRFRLTIVNQPPNGRASFDQFAALPAIEAIVPARSTASRTVYVTSSDARARIDVSVTEVVPQGVTPLTGTIVLNPDIDNPDIDNPDIDNPDIDNPDIDNAEVYNPDIDNPDIDNPDIDNPDIDNPDIDNPDIDNIRVANPDIDNPDIDNPDIDNPDIDNPDIDNPDIDNPDIDNASLMSDVTWTITNTGNTTTAYNVNLFFAQTTFDPTISTQLLLYRTYKTPVVQNCVLKTQTQNILVANIPNPQLVQSSTGDVSDPNDPEITNATLYLAPGETARITLRIFDPDPEPGSTVVVTNPDGTTAIVPAQFVPNEDVTPVIQQQGVDTEDLEEGVTEPPLVIQFPPPTTVPDSAATAENSPVTLNVLANDGSAFGSTRVISLHPAGMGSHTGAIAGDLAFQPSTGFLYTQRGALDPGTNRIVGRFPAPALSNGFISQFANRRTGINYGRSTGTTSFLIALDARPDTATFHQYLPMPALSDSVLGLALDAVHGRLFAAHGPTTATPTTPTTVSVIDVNPASATFHQVVAAVSLPIGIRAQAIAVNSRTRRAYVSASAFVGGNTAGVFVFDSALASPVATRVSNTNNTFGIAVNEAENLVFAAAFTGGLFALHVIDGGTGAVTTVNTPFGMRTGQADERLVVHEASGKVFMRLFNTVVVIDGHRASPTRNTVVANITVGRENGGVDIAVDQQLGLVVTVGNLDFRADTINVATNGLIDTMPLNSGPSDVAIDPLNHRAFVAVTNYVQEINLAPFTYGDALPVFVESGGILLNPTTNRGYGGVSTTFAGIGIFSGSGFLGYVPGVPTAGRHTFAERHVATNRHVFANAGDETGTTSDPGSVVIINGGTDTVETLAGVAANPFGIGINQATGHVYIATLGAAGVHGTIEVGDATTLGEVGTVTGVGGPLPSGFTLNNPGALLQFGRHVVVNPANNKVYVMQLSGGSPNSVAVLNPTTLVLKPLDGQAGTPLFDAQAAGENWGRVEVIRVHPGLNRIYLGMTNAAGDTRIVAINSADDSVVGSWLGGAHSNLSTASYLIVNEAMNRLYVSNFENHTLTTLDATTLAVIGTTNVPDGPAALAFNAAANRVYVSSVIAKMISAVDGESLAVLSSVRLPLVALFMQVDPVESRIYTSGGGGSGDEAGTMVITDVLGQLGTNVSVKSVGAALHGTVQLDADYSVTYTPAPGYSGPDSFTYEMETPNGTAIGTVTIDVIPSVPTPIAFSDNYSITSGQTLNIVAPGPLANDAVAAGATMVVVDEPDHGDLTPVADGSFGYVPDPGFTGTDTFTYHAVSLQGATNDVTVTISVTPVATFVVTTTADSGAGSLRQAILNANFSSGAVITFNIPGAGPHVIQPTTVLPTLTVPMTIDGYSQPGSSVNTLPVGTNAVIAIRLVGSSIPGSTNNGLSVNGGNSTIRGLNIAGFSQIGILLDVLGGNTVEGNFIGTNLTGTAAQSNGGGAVSAFTPNNVIGGSTPAARNLLSGNGTNHGVRVQPRTAGNTIVHDGAGTVIRGNLIGTNALGTAAIANLNGIAVLSPNVTVGGVTAAERNVISGNTNTGVTSFPQRNGATVLTVASNLVIQGNYIGVRADGTGAVSNGVGLSLSGPNSVIGGTAGTTVGACTGACNVISGNTGNGINVNANFDNTAGSPTLGTLFSSAAGSQVVGNFIGLEPAGNAPIPNGGIGVSVTVPAAVIGGTSAGSRNVIAGNGNTGISLGTNFVNSTGALVGAASNAQILGNYVGVAADGVTPRGNAGGGINVSTSGVTIGGTTAPARNVIAGNTGAGINSFANTFDVDGGGPGAPVVLSTPNNLTVQGNYIGVNANGAALGNSGIGIQVNGISVIGGTTGVSPTSCTGACNVVSGNLTHGITVNAHVDAASGVIFSSAAGTQIMGNYIGMNPAGTAAVPNGPPLPAFSAGINASAQMVVGGPTSLHRNIISGNRSAGVNLATQHSNGIVSSTAAGSTFHNNYIGVGPDGATAFANGGTGLQVSVPNVTIGDTGLGNVISGNAVGGISAFASQFDPDGAGPLPNVAFTPPIVASGLIVRGNRVGTNAAGTAAVPNGNPGGMNLSAPGALVSGNVISGNAGYGVQLGQHFNTADGTVYAAATGSTVQNNIIGLNASGTAALPNSTNGVSIGAANVTVGGSGSGERNVISGNASHGVSIFQHTHSTTVPVGSATGAIVRGNFIGFDISGVNPLPNGNGGVISTAANTTVGGPNAGDGNLITHPSSLLTGFGILFGRQVNSGVVTSAGGGSTASGNTIGINAVGARTGARASGVLVRSADNMVLGNVIAGRGSNALPIEPAAILIEAFVSEPAGVGSADGNIVRGNYIGTTAAGAPGINNFSEGIAISNASNTIIGGPAAGDRNVIVGGAAAGIHVSATIGNTSADSVIEGNYIGLMPDGVTASGNTIGVYLDSSVGTTGSVSGTTIANNVIAGNSLQGIQISNPLVSNTTIRGNRIGTSADGTLDRGNVDDGIIINNSSGHTIGGLTPADGNTLAFNTDGVSLLTGGTGNRILSNSIHSNSFRGIHIGTGGIPNDPGDADGGPNNQQNFPVLSGATNQFGTTRVTADLTSFAAGNYTVQYFANTTCVSNQGQRFLATVAGVAAGGVVQHDTGQMVLPGEYLTATATDAGGNTSEFSPCTQVSGGTSIVVTNTNDSGAGSLRAAIDAANSAPGAQLVTFNIPGVTPASPGVISLASALPAINEAVVIDGESQPGHDGLPLVEVRGGGIGTGWVGLFLNASNITIRGLSITRFADGVFGFQTFSGHVLERNLIGTNRTHTVGSGNGRGIAWRANSSTIRENIISGNVEGVVVHIGGSSNQIFDNGIGVREDGVTLLGNTGNGVTLYDGANNNTFHSNIIGGNGGWGIDIQHSGSLAPVSGTIIRNSQIGIDGNENDAGNALGGIKVQNAPNSSVGIPGDGNLISGNGGHGLFITAPSTAVVVHVNQNSIGINHDDVARPNDGDGIRIEGQVTVNVGGTGAGQLNTISGNAGHGVSVVNSPTTPATTVRGNYIGLATDGITAIPNLQAGIATQNGALVVGGSTAAARNVISGNQRGILLSNSGGTFNTTITGNYIGTDVTGLLDRGNAIQGINVGSAPGTRIGGTAAGEGNVISGNLIGVTVEAISHPVINGLHNTIIQGNIIGLNATGATPLPNVTGVTLNNSHNLVGGDTAASANVIAGNDQVGIVVAGVADRNTIARNRMFSNNGLGIDLAGNGVSANDAGDGDSGANALQNFPVLANAQNVGGQTLVDVDLSSFAAGSYTIRFYANVSCDPSGNGEGETFVGEANLAQPGLAGFVLNQSVPIGHSLSATATDALGNTSEFAACAVISTSF